MELQKGARVGFLSRFDYGSSGFRQSAIREAFRILEKIEATHFNIFVGGLVSQKDIIIQMKEYVKKRGKKLSPKERVARKIEFEEFFLRRCAKDLARVIPVITGPDPEDPQKTKTIDFFVVTSPAFDGEVGERVAQLLSEERADVRVMNQGGDRFVVKYINKLIWVLTPTKAVWMRGDYYSTPAERVIKDKIKQTSQTSPDVYVVGCFAISIHKPLGELKYQYATVPACCRLESVRVSDNQIGVSILDFPADGGQHAYRTHSLKDLVSGELGFIVSPDGASTNQKKIIDLIKTRGWVTPGLIHTALDISPEDIEREMKRLMEKKTFRRSGQNWPGIFFQERSRKYYFNLTHLQRQLRYAPIAGPFQEDRIVSFACLHAGSTETDYKYFVNRVPEIILANDAQLLVGAGDIVEGTKHNLMIKGEIIGGADITSQEKWAANMVGMVMMKVFEARFRKLIEKTEKEKITQEKVLEVIKAALIMFNVIPGNHDLWSKELGHNPLETFRATLLMFLNDEIQKILVSQKLPTLPLTKTVGERIVSHNIFELASGLRLSVQHPHMSRAKTTSIRPQEMLDFGKRHSCQVVIGANFHVGETVNEWDMDLGQCVCQQIGTIKHGSNFERNKMKMVDQGIGYLRVVSKDKRIVMTESVFDRENNPQPPVSNSDVINMYLQSIGIVPIV